MSEPYNRSSRFYLSYSYDCDLYVDGVRQSFNPNRGIYSSVINLPVICSASGFTNPYWKNAIRHVEDATTTFTGVKRDGGSDWSIWSSTWRNSKPTPSGPNLIEQSVYGHLDAECQTLLPVANTAPSDFMTRVDNTAKARFVQKIDEVRSSVETGQDLGELKQTLQALEHPMRSMRRFTLEFLDTVKKRSLRVRGYKELHRVIGESYLEYRFGWRPLALDVADAISGLTSNSHYTFVPVHASASDTYLGSSSAFRRSTFPGGGHISYVTNALSRSRYSVRYKGMTRNEVDSAGRAPIAQVLQLDLPHALPTVWDLLPYSFLVDYFTNVGDIIRAYSLVGNNLRWCCKTTLDETRVDYSVDLDKADMYLRRPGPTWVLEGVRGGYTAWGTARLIHRLSVSPAQLVPKFAFSIPVSTRPWENMAALFATRALPLQNYLIKKFTR